MIIQIIPNNMWKTLLIIGISIAFTLTSCDKTDNDGPTKTNYNFKNNTNQNVELQVKDISTQIIQTYLLEPNQEKTFSKTCTDGAGNGICYWFVQENDLTFKFITDNNCLTNFPKSKSPVMYDNFSTEMYNSNENTLIYLIDTEEVTAATTCN